MQTLLSSLTPTEMISLTSVKSATAATGSVSGYSPAQWPSPLLGSNAPRQRRGRNALIGVKGRRLAESGTIGPWAERL